jgi:DNA-binding NarL/FixJ family response regulator
MQGRSFPRSRIVLAVQSFLEADYNVVGAVSDGQSLIEAIEQHSPDVAVVDVSMPRLTGLEAARQMRDMGSPTRVVFLTLQGDPEYLHAALAAGAVGYVLKYRLECDLPRAIEAALGGRRFVSPPLADLEIGASQGSHRESIGPRKIKPNSL